MSIARAQVKAGKTCENLLNNIRQIIYSLYWEEEIQKDTIFMNSVNRSIVVQFCNSVIEFWYSQIIIQSFA